MLLGLSEHMLWIQSMPRVPYVYKQVPTCWIGLGMTIIVYTCITLIRAYFKPRGVKKDSVPYMVEVALTNVPIYSWIVYPYVYWFLYGPGQALVFPPNDVEIVWCWGVSSL